MKKNIKLFKKNSLAHAVSLAVIVMAANQTFAANNGNTTTNTSSATSLSYVDTNTPAAVAAQSSSTVLNNGPFGNLVLTGSATDTKASGTSGSPIYAQVDSNTIVNNSNVTSGGIAFTGTASATSSAFSSYYFTSAGPSSGATSSVATAYSKADTTDNTATNTGTVIGATGVGLNSSATSSATAESRTYVWANNDGQVAGEYPSATTTASTTSSAIANSNSNSVQNSGVINATNYGVQIKSLSTATSSSTVVTGGYYGASNQSVGLTGDFGFGSNSFSATGTTNAVSSTNTNTVTNAGNILVSSGSGVTLEASSSASSGNYSSGSNSAGSSSSSSVNTNSIVNTGNVSAAGASSDGIGLYSSSTSLSPTSTVNSNSISNTGLIYADRNGISLTAAVSTGSLATINSNSITNTYSGRIVADAIGVNLVATNVTSNTITNSGLIVADPGLTLSGAELTKSAEASFDTTVTGSAIKISGLATGGTGNTVNLNAPTYLAGRLLFSSSPNSYTTVNLTSGVSHSNLWSIQNSGNYAPTAVTLNGPLPWFVKTSATGTNGVVNNMYASLDPSALAAAPNMLADLSGMVSGLMSANLSKDLKAKDSLWVAGQAGGMKVGGDSVATMNQNSHLNGIAVGFDTTVAKDYRVGVMVGINNSSLRTGSMYSDLYANSHTSHSNGAFLSIQAATKLDNAFDFSTGLSIGTQDTTTSRFVNDNLKWWGISYANSNYNSKWISPMARLALPISAGNGFVISPNAQVSYSRQFNSDYTETGASSNATYGSQVVAIVERRFGLDLTKSVGGFTGVVSGGYMGRSYTGSDSVSVTMIDDTHNLNNFYRNMDARYLKANLAYNLDKTTELSISGSYINGTAGVSGSSGNIMIKHKFN